MFRISRSEWCSLSRTIRDAAGPNDPVASPMFLNVTRLNAIFPQATPLSSIRDPNNST